jgi:NAD/NADP transhydrogenase alpha subunit
LRRPRRGERAARRADSWLAFAALVLTAINMFGGFAVTRRMLAMFRK